MARKEHAGFMDPLTEIEARPEGAKGTVEAKAL
jgi:hypothetical protein